MPRVPPSAGAIGVGSTVIAVAVAGASLALTWNVVLGLALMAVAVLITMVLIVWYVIGSRNERADKKKVEAARIEALRPPAIALASLAEPRGSTAIRLTGGGRIDMQRVSIKGFDKAIDTDGSLTMTDVDAEGPTPNPEVPQSPEPSKHDQ